MLLPVKPGITFQMWMAAGEGCASPPKKHGGLCWPFAWLVPRASPGMEPPGRQGRRGKAAALPPSKRPQAPHLSLVGGFARYLGRDGAACSPPIIVGGADTIIGALRGPPPSRLSVRGMPGSLQAFPELRRAALAPGVGETCRIGRTRTGGKAGIAQPQAASGPPSFQAEMGRGRSLLESPGT